jgi:poly(3-hydroxybutyrate) depolymerase
MFPAARRFCRVAALAIMFLLNAALLDAQDSAVAVGTGRFVVEPKSGASHKRITVWTYGPEGLTQDAPVLFVLHGTRRDAERYRNQWQGYAAHAGALLLVPEFSALDFPGRRNYSAPKPGTDWTADQDLPSAIFSVIDAIFDRVVSSARLRTKEYHLYGHSAGAQFVHRFMLFHRRSRARAAVAANAGWYTMPDFAIGYPYGLRNSGIGESQLKIALSQKLFVLLGENDTDAHHPTLNRSAAAMRQGRQRFERGQNFFRAAAHAAKHLNAPFQWQIETVPDAGHDNAKMAGTAARRLFGR